MKRQVKSIRLDLNYNQDEMAALLNISKSSYQKKESGISPFLAREIIKISSISGVDVSNIYIPL